MYHVLTKDAFLTAKAKINPILKKAGIGAGWTSGGAGSFDPVTSLFWNTKTGLWRCGYHD